MNICYVSPSSFPTRSANSVHVINQCNALAECGKSVTLIATSQQKYFSKSDLTEYYGIEVHEKVDLYFTRYRFIKGQNLFVAFVGVWFYFFHSNSSTKFVSRNLYFSFVLSMLRIKHLFETHTVETGIKSYFQSFILKHQDKSIVISNALSSLLEEKYKKHNYGFLVLHDAANEVKKTGDSKFLTGSKAVKIGYFGHLYEGRGIEIILEIAEKFQSVDFYIAGGEPPLVSELQAKIKMSNVFVLGHLQNSEARSLMVDMDILLMPSRKGKYWKKIVTPLNGCLP